MKLLSEGLIDLDARPPRLFLSEFNGPRDHGPPILSRAAAIRARLPPQSGNLLLPISLYLPPQRGIGDPFPLAIGQRHFLLTQLLEKPSPSSCRNLLQQDGAQERTPEDNPLLVLI